MRVWHRVIGVALLVVASGAAMAAQTDDGKKFKYENIPVEASCMEGYHPTVDPKWGNVFPCLKDAAIVAPPTKPVGVASPVRAN